MYKYREIRKRVLTESGLKTLKEVRKRTNQLFKKSEIIRMEDIIHNISGNNWTVMACVDRLAELDEITEITDLYLRGQDRIFTKV